MSHLPKRIKIVLMIFTIILFIIAATSIFLTNAYENRDRLMSVYNEGISAINEGHYQEGIDILSELGDYQDSLSYIEDANNWISFENAKTLVDLEKYDDAKALFETLSKIDGFEGAEQANKYIKQIDAIYEEREQEQQRIEQEQALLREKEQQYGNALQYYRDKDYAKALSAFESLGDYKDSVEYTNECRRAIKILTRSITLSAGTNASAGITETGEIAFSGRTVLTPADVAGWNDIVSISIKGSYAIGLKIDGTTITGGGSSEYVLDTSTWSNIIAVSAGDLYVVGLKEDGTLVALGHNGDGQINIHDWTNIVSISTGWRLTVGLDSKGDIHIAGIMANAKMRDIESNKEAWSNIVAVSAGGSTTPERGDAGHIVALRRDGTVIAVGDNDCGQCNVDSEQWPEWTDIIAVSAGAYHTVGLRRDGTVVTTQTGSVADRIKEWEDIVAVSAGYGFTLGLKSDGSIVSAGFNLDGQRDTDGWDRIVARAEWAYIFE